jgi:hypothetical protein
MPGHVFHPGHSELHGMTVVVETAGPLTYLGRYDHEDAAGIHLLNVGVYQESSGVSKQEYIERSSKFGVRSELRHLTVPVTQVTRITQLGAWEPALPQG